MADLLADENVPLNLVHALEARGHDVQTALAAGLANRRVPDPDFLAQATVAGRAVLTLNRKDFHRLHRTTHAHAGIVTIKRDADTEAWADRIHRAIEAVSSLSGQLIRVTKSSP